MSTEQISGVLVHARPDSALVVTASLEQMPGVEVHADLGDGRLIVTAESSSEKGLAETFAAIRDVDGVLSTSLTYHYTDQSSSLDEEMPA